MDKQRQDRISIRINGKEKNFLSEDELNQEIAAASDRIHEDEQYDTTFDIDIEVKEDEPLQTNVIDFEEVRIEKGHKPTIRKKTKLASITPPRLGPNKKKKHRTPLLQRRSAGISSSKKLLGALLSAVIIGIGFGYIVLSLFTDISEPTGPTSATIQPTGTNQQAVSGDATVPPASNAQAPLAEINAMNVSVIQGGAFSSPEAAQQYATNLQANGQAAVVVPNTDPALMFIGIGMNTGELEPFSQHYQNQGQEIYVKSIGTPKIDPSLLDSTVFSFVANGQALFMDMNSLTSKAFVEGAIDDQTWSSLEQSYTTWNNAIPSELPEQLTTFSIAIADAYHALADYQTSGTEADLWKSQQALLEGFLVYDEWATDF